MGRLEFATSLLIFVAGLVILVKGVLPAFGQRIQGCNTRFCTYSNPSPIYLVVGLGMLLLLVGMVSSFVTYKDWTTAELQARPSLQSKIYEEIKI